MAVVSNGRHSEFSVILALASPALRPVCESLRRMIGSIDEGFVELVWPKHRIASYGIGPKKMVEHYAYIGVHNAHVNLGFYRGASLEDPERLLEGTGKELRHVKVRAISAVKNPAIRALLCQAVAERRKHARGT